MTQITPAPGALHDGAATLLTPDGHTLRRQFGGVAYGATVGTSPGSAEIAHPHADRVGGGLDRGRDLAHPILGEPIDGA